ncbi:MAG: hypothetical protein K2X38_23940 [Gemmataceae bacterium]|nr:hypothetical protein [Gemmataceae bacterium]
MVRISLVFASALASIGRLQAQPEGAPLQMNRVLRSVADAKNYAWTSQDSPGPEAAPVKAEYEKGKPLHVVADKLACYRQGNNVVYLADKEWARSRTGTLSDPLRILGPVAKVRSLRLPHEETTIVLESGPKGEVTVRKEKTQTKWSFSLKEEAVRKLIPPRYSQVAKDGAIEIWGESGNLVRYRIQITLQGTIGNAEIDGQYLHVVAVKDIGDTMVMPPAAAMKLLEPMP